jgi:elongation factor G
MAVAIAARERKDDVKLGAALTKLTDEDPSITVIHNAETGDVVLKGQGEMHLRVAVERLARPLRRRHFHPSHRVSAIAKRSAKASPSAAATRSRQAVTGSSAMSSSTSSRLPRGSGFQFTSAIKGGVVPQQYVPSVEHGVRDYLKTGPLGFPVVDVAVTLDRRLLS